MTTARLGHRLPGGWDPPDLRSMVACVTGASYGVGRGICEVLGQCGATVYLSGRSTRNRAGDSARWTVEETAELVVAAGGVGVPVVVDHTEDGEVASLFDRIADEHGSLDLLVNNAWQWGPRSTYWATTWEQPMARWDAMFGVGVRGTLLATRCAVPLMLDRGGLIVATQERPGNEDRFADNIVVDTAVTAVQRMIRYFAWELADTEVAALLVYLGWARTVNMGMGFDHGAAGMSEDAFMARTQSPHLVGRAIAELAADVRVGTKSGRTLYCGNVALEYGFTDVDGRVPAYDGGELARPDSEFPPT